MGPCSPAIDGYGINMMGRAKTLGISKLLLVGLLLFFSGCVSAQQIQRYPSLTPKVAGATSPSIGIDRIVSQIPTGTEIGTIQAGLACVGQGRQFWTKAGDLDQTAGSMYAAIAREEFRKAG